MTDFVSFESLSSGRRGSVRTSVNWFYYNYLKRVFDILLVVGSAPFTVPLIAVLGLIISLDGGSPFYCQARIGRSGKAFTFWKLRSMVVGADAKLAAYLAANPDAQQEWNETQKLRNDPRVTPLGKLIRKTSLDELPQLWNIFRGDMSIVGPRPMMPEQVSLYSSRAYFDMTPGLTGLWQVEARNRSSFASRAEYDDAYASQLSFAADARIIWKTFGVVFSATGV